MLADHGAKVIRVERPDVIPAPGDPLLRSRSSITLNLKNTDDISELRKLCATADGLIEGFRPGVAERLGLGPEQCQARNSRLVYGRMTGWGQDGPLSASAGHDITYLAVTGAQWSADGLAQSADASVGAQLVYGQARLFPVRRNSGAKCRHG